MSSIKLRLQNFPKPQLIIFLIVIFFILISIIIFAGLRASKLFRQQYFERQTQQMKVPQSPIKRAVKRLLLKKTLDDGTIQYVEILSNGLVNIYDADMNLIKSDLTSYYKVKELFDKINSNLDNFQSDSQGNIVLLIDTNKGQFSIVIDQSILDEIHAIINDILDDIKDIIDDVFAPTPTIQPTPTQTPGQPTLIPLPSNPSTPTPSGPKPTPNPNATPTPLPDYMTAPPFKCSDYEYVGRPINISNIICGVD